jgi:hypothetical protein
VARPRVFISFDYDDLSVKEGPVVQARDPRCPFDFVDNSITDVLSGSWAAEARRLIKDSEYVAVLCGLQSHKSKGQFTELQITKEEGRRYSFRRASRDRPATRPKSASSDEPMYPATWPTVAALLRGERPLVS